jgi:L-threonylcarbamoyladenylate synthase
MKLHYAPNARVVLASMEQVPERIAEYAALSARVGVLSARRAESWPAQVPWLSMGHSPDQQAQQLYRRLREADDMDLAVLIVVPPDGRGLNHALRDRLWRAAGLGHALA